jgi:hypothetical protein
MVRHLPGLGNDRIRRHLTGDAPMTTGLQNRCFIGLFRLAPGQRIRVTTINKLLTKLTPSDKIVQLMNAAFI